MISDVLSFVSLHGVTLGLIGNVRHLECSH